MSSSLAPHSSRLFSLLARCGVAHVDDAVRDVVLTIHWKGGQHSELKVRKRS
ncbi:hypothetical protein HFN77_33590 [Rhizobium laguerreae]|nr:hypothetical protein [Rhizobium laguerreae]